MGCFLNNKVKEQKKKSDDDELRDFYNQLRTRYQLQAQQKEREQQQARKICLAEYVKDCVKDGGGKHDIDEVYSDFTRLWKKCKQFSAPAYYDLRQAVLEMKRYICGLELTWCSSLTPEAVAFINFVNYVLKDEPTKISDARRVWSRILEMHFIVLYPGTVPFRPKEEQQLAVI